MTRGEMDLLKAKDAQEKVIVIGGTASHAENMSATDYRERLDGKEKMVQAPKKVVPAAADFDMFAEDVDDMFAPPGEEGLGVGKKGKTDGTTACILFLVLIVYILESNKATYIANWLILNFR